jgi:hypothetical protein
MHLPELEVGALVLIAWARLLSVKHNIVFCHSQVINYYPLDLAN